MSGNNQIGFILRATFYTALIVIGLVSGAAAGSEDVGRGGRPRMADSLWIEDLDCFARELPLRHKHLFFRLSREDFSTMMSRLRDRVSDLADYEIVVSLMAILAEVGDSHTLLGTGYTGMFGRLPVRLEWYSDGLRVVAAVPELRDMLGKRILGIEGRPIEEVDSLVGTLIPHDNEARLLADGPGLMAIPEVLAALGIAGDPDTVVFEVETLGEVEVAEVKGRRKISWVSVRDGLECDPPLHAREPESPYWLAWLESERALYLAYRSCREVEDRPFSVFTEEVLGRIDEGRVKKLILDMRHNSGGSSAIAGPLISGIRERPAVNSEGHLFIVVGRKTFSSAILNVLDLMDGTDAIVVGEATGGKPNHFGEVKFFLLPNSGIPVQYSTKYFRTYPEDLPSIYPDVEVRTSFEDFISCRDPVLETILEYPTR